MPTQTQIQDTILSASYKNALLVQNNYNYTNAGNTAQKESLIQWAWLNIAGLQFRFDLGDYTSSTTTTIYDRLNLFIGFDTDINSIDPNAQIPGTTIIIVNPSGFISPIDPITWSDFNPAYQTTDGNRARYDNTNWKGVNPVLSLTSPAETALRLGVDYTLVPSGGIILLNDLSGSGSPGIADGQSLRATSYTLA